MSHRQIALNADLCRLRDEEYHLEIRGGFLLIHDVPYVNAACQIGRGTLVSRLELDGDLTSKPTDHVTHWIGEHPCHSDGRKLAAFENASPPQDLGNGIAVNHTFSAKADYRDYHHKMTTYLGRIVGEARTLDQAVTAQTAPVYAVEDETESVFRYIDTASSRARIGAFNEKVAAQRIGIVGLGGTGAYVLDLVAKTPVQTIQLFDADRFSSHNAFRAPGAATLDQLNARPQKVAHWAATYDALRRGIVANDVFLDASNVDRLKDLDFVFLCLDDGPAKRVIVEALETGETPFVDVGMGVLRGELGLSGLVRTTFSTAPTRQFARRWISFAENDGEVNEYATNIQIAELNALNAALAVIRWKKWAGIYRDSGRECYAGYSIAANEIVNEDAA